MSYPPAALPTNRTNATPQTNNHPQDHNAIGAAISDIVAALGPTVLGTFPTVDARIAYQGIRNHIGGVNHFNDFGGFIIEATSSVTTLDTNGNVLVTFPTVMHTVPTVLVTQGDYAGRSIRLSVSSPSTTNFTLSGVYLTTGAPAANATVRANWIALCARTS